MNVIGTKIDAVRLDGSLEKFVQDLTLIRDMGIEAVELPAHGLDVIFNGRLVNRRMDEIVAVLKNFDFLYSVHAPNPINLMDRKDPNLHGEVLCAALDFAGRVGAKAVVYHGGRYIPEEEFNVSGNRDFSQTEKQALLEQETNLLQSISSQFSDIIIAVENARPYISQSPYTYAESVDSLKKQILGVNQPNVKINLDFGHLYMCSTFYGFDLLEAVEKIKDLVAHTHIHDNFGGVVHHYEKQQTHQLPFGRGDGHMPVGWGNLPIGDVLDILLPEYKGLLMMELRSRYFPYIIESRDCLAALAARAMIGES